MDNFNQKQLLKIANSEAGRFLLGIRDKYAVVKIIKNSFHQLIDFQKDKPVIRASFYTWNKIASILMPALEKKELVLRSALKDKNERVIRNIMENPYEAFLHYAGLERIKSLSDYEEKNWKYPQIYLLVATFHPNADPESTSVDGDTIRSGVNETFATIRAGAGTGANDSSAVTESPQLTGSTTTDRFQSINRSFYLFDTNSLGSSADITIAVFSIEGTGKNNAIGQTTIDVVSSAPASNTALVAGDHTTLGTTVYASITYANFITTGYNDFTLDANGRNHISKTGVSKFGTRLGWDTANSFTGTWASAANTRFNPRYAETASTTSDPKLVVTYTFTLPAGIIGGEI